METANIILAFVGALLSLLFRYLPKLKQWFDAQEQKGLIMVGVVLLASIGYFVFGCIPALATWLDIVVPCTLAGALSILEAFVSILIGNQLAYLVTKE